MRNVRLDFSFVFVCFLILRSLSITQGARQHQLRPGKRQAAFGIFNDKNKPGCKRSDNDHDSTFCEHIVDYPKRYVEQLIKNSKLSVVRKEFFVDRKKLKNTIPVVTRKDDSNGKDYMCPSIRVTIFPQRGRTTKGEWKLIPNHGNYSQPVEIERCYETGPCNIGYLQHLVKVQSRCKQIYMARKLVSFDDSRNPIVESFLLPSACVCTYATAIENTFNPALQNPALQ